MEKDLITRISSLDGEEAIAILISLAKKDAQFAKAVRTDLDHRFSEVSIEEVANLVFSSLNSVPIEDCWEQAGKTRWGSYRDVDDVAYDIANDIMRLFAKEISRFGKLGGKKLERLYLQGVILGLYLYQTEVNSDFSICIEEFPRNAAESLIHKWLDLHKEEHQEIENLHIFLSTTCPEWDELLPSTS
jgi:hypothetical protein